MSDLFLCFKTIIYKVLKFKIITLSNSLLVCTLCKVESLVIKFDNLFFILFYFVLCLEYLKNHRQLFSMRHFYASREYTITDRVSCSHSFQHFGRGKRGVNNTFMPSIKRGLKATLKTLCCSM